MYLSDYLIYIVAIMVCAILSAAASKKVRSAYQKYSTVRARSGYTGSETVKRLLRTNNVYGITVGKVGGELTDHYHPANGVVNLSESTYDQSSVAAVAVAAHEMGHVMQKQDGHLFYRIRTALVPVVNIGSRLAMPLVFLGLIMNIFMELADPDIGFKIAMVGVILYGGALLFSVVTLPVELNASRRAKQMLLDNGILAEDEIKGAGEVLSAAALTYVASVLANMVNFLGFLVRVLSMFGRRDRR